MTAYETWTVGEKVIAHVADVKKNQRDGIITLTCHSFQENALSGDTDPRDEIAYFEAMQTRDINNEPLINGGTKLQARNIITVTDDNDTWTRCALEPIEVVEDNLAGDVITYILNIHYELPGTGGSKVYTPLYNAYDNIEYYFFYDPGPPEVKESGASQGDLDGTELGWMQITEEENVKKVEVYGCACELPAKIYVNDEERIWHYGEVEGTPYAEGNEKFTWELDTPTTAVTIKTTKHTDDICDGNWCDNHGAWLMWVKNTFE